MNGTRPILLATDGSPSAAEAQKDALELAQRLDAPLLVVSVAHPTLPAVGYVGYGYSNVVAELAEAEQRRVQELLATIAATAAVADVPCSTVAADGFAVEEICRVASCPVLTVGPALALRAEVKFKQILFPTDLSEDSKRIVPYLREIAEDYKAAITILHVMPEELVFNRDAATLAEPIRTTMIHTFEKELGGSKLEFLIGFGETVETILRTARAKDADLIAMGIHNTFLPAVTLRSSSAYRIMTGAHCPVLTYRHREREVTT